jgi:hypothetical protein
MHISPFVILLGWIPAGAYLFRRYPVRIAILANFFGGWAILPGANYQADSPSRFPYWILGVCLPADYFLTKATATGLAALVGNAAFSYRGFEEIQAGHLRSSHDCLVLRASAFGGRALEDTV